MTRSLMLVVTAVLVAGGLIAWRLPQPTSHAEAAVDRPIPRSQEIRSISFDGTRLPQARLRDLIETRPGQQLDTARLARDRDAMERALADLGYLSARVSPAIITFDAVGAAYITFEIDMGKMFHLRRVEVTGPGKDVAVLTLARGDEAIRARIEQARLAFIESLERRSKPTRRGAPPSAPIVELTVHTDVEAAAVDITLATR